MSRQSTVLVIVSLLALMGTASATTITSIDDGGWSDPAKWSPAVVPTANDSVVIDHAMNIDNACQCAFLHISSTGSAYNSYGYRTLTVYGDAIVEGAVFFGGWPLTLRLHGDLTLETDLVCDVLDFAGTTDQQISLGSGGLIHPTTMNHTGAGQLVATTPIRLSTNADLGGGTLLLNPGTGAEFNAGITENGTIVAGGETLTLRGGAHLGNITVSDPTLEGIARIYSGVQFSGQTTITDTLQIHHGSTTLTVDDITNNGHITDGGWSFYVRILGDFVNNGTVDNFQVTFGGAGITHTISQSPGTWYGPTNMVNEAGTGMVTIDGDVEIGSVWDLGGGTAKLAAGANLTLLSGSIKGGELYAGGEDITSVAGTNFSQITVHDPVFWGTTSLYGGGGIVLAGEVINEGTLRPHPPGTNKPIVDGNILNRGIVDQSGGGALRMAVNGNIENEGTWDIELTHLTGSIDQIVALSDSYPMAAMLTLNSSLGGTGHYWTLDGIVQSGYTGVDADFVPANSSHHGVWQCHSSAGSSRLFTLQPPWITSVVGEYSPPAFSLAGNSPNPFNPTTTIHFSTSRESVVRLDMFDLRGRLVATLADEVMSAGDHRQEWNAVGFPSGHYFYRLRTDGESKTGRCTLIR